ELQPAPRRAHGAHDARRSLADRAAGRVQHCRAGAHRAGHRRNGRWVLLWAVIRRPGQYGAYSGEERHMRRLFWPADGLLLALLVISPLRPTPARAATQAAPMRGIIFVHGIHGDARLPGFEAVLQPLADPTRYVFESFEYWDDVANRSSSGQCDARLIPASTVGGFPVDVPASGAPAFCDSEDDVGLNAVLLDHEITTRTSPGPQGWPVDRITLVANSMGGAIVRAYLAYAVESGNPSLARVDSIVFLQGAQEGSWLGKADQGANQARVSRIPGV